MRRTGADSTSRSPSVARHRRSQASRTLDEAVLLRAAVGVQQQVELAGRGDVEQKVQERHVRGHRGPDGLHGNLHQIAAAAGGHVPAQPRPGRLAVPHTSLLCFPGSLERHLRGHPVDAQHGLTDVREGVRAKARDRAAVAHQPAAHLEHVLTRGPRREGGGAVLSRERVETILRGTDPLPADVDPPVRLDLQRLQAAAHPVARLQHDEGRVAALQLGRRGEPGHPRPDHGDVRLERAGVARASAEGSHAADPTAAGLRGAVDNVRRMTSRREEKDQRRAERLAAEQASAEQAKRRRLYSIVVGGVLAVAAVARDHRRGSYRWRRRHVAAERPARGRADLRGRRDTAAAAGNGPLRRRPGGRLRAAKPGDRGPHPRPSGQGRQVQDRPAHVGEPRSGTGGGRRVLQGADGEDHQALRAHARARPDRDPVRPHVWTGAASPSSAACSTTTRTTWSCFRTAACPTRSR